MTAQFAQPTSDENLIPGWSVQGGGVGQSTSGIPGQGYATAANVTTSLAAGAGGQLGSGVPQPQGALNVGAEASGSQTVAILTNNGYSNATGAANRALPATIGAQSLTEPTVAASGTAVNNPSTTLGLAALVVVTGTITGVSVKNSAGTAINTTVQATPGSYTVPAGGSITLTYSSAPTWQWYV